MPTLIKHIWREPHFERMEKVNILQNSILEIVSHTPWLNRAMKPLLFKGQDFSQTDIETISLKL